MRPVGAPPRYMLSTGRKNEFSYRVVHGSKFCNTKLGSRLRLAELGVYRKVSHLS